MRASPRRHICATPRRIIYNLCAKGASEKADARQSKFRIFMQGHNMLYPLLRRRSPQKESCDLLRADTCSIMNTGFRE